MTGLRLTLPSSFTDTSLLKLLDDPLLTEGSLMLFEPNHPIYPWAAGVPNTTTWLPNAAVSKAKTLLGSTADSAIGTQLYIGSGWIEGSGAGQSGITERTTKGGIHTITSRLRAPANNAKRFNLGSAYGAYFNANATHDFYISMWKKSTRDENPFGPQYPFYANWRTWTGTVNGYLGTFMKGGSNPGSGVGVFTANEGVNSTLNLDEVSKMGVLAVNNGQSVGSAVVPSADAGWGAGPSWGNYGAYPEAAPYPNNSMVVYRWYAEDLTVSGRTYAQVAALDNAEHVKQVLTAGGRYFGDTYTDPATIA